MAKEKNMNQDAANDEEMTVTLTLDDGTDLECVVLTIFEAADKEYIALLPLYGNEAEDGDPGTGKTPGKSLRVPCDEGRV